MRLLTYIALFLMFSTGCKKTVQNKQEDLLVMLITTGQWGVTSFIKGNTDVTANFAEYQFQFKKDNTVDAIKGSVVEKTGTWQGNANERSIISQFTNANSTLMLLNGNWYVTNSGLTFVTATQTVNGEMHSLRLDKL